MNFSKDEIDFLNRFGVAASQVLDARGLKKVDYVEIMRSMRYKLVYGVTPCRKYGHILRTQAGHCAQCNPRNLVFEGRYYQRAFVYVAFSEKSGVVKVGISNNINERQKTLRSQSYGGQCDWVMCWSDEVDSAGEVEAAIHAELKGFEINLEHFRDGKKCYTMETFICELSKAINTAKLIIKKMSK